MAVEVNPLARTFAGLVYYGHMTIDKVPEYLKTEVDTLLLTYGEDPYSPDIATQEELNSIASSMNLKIEGVVQKLAETATKSYVAEEIIKVNSGGSIDLSHKADVTYVDEKVSSIVAVQKTPKDLQSQILYNSESALLHDFQTNITQNYGSVDYDPNIKFSGKRSLKITITPDKNHSIARVDLGVGGKDLKNSYLTLMGRLTSGSQRLANLQLQLWGDGFENLGTWNRVYGGPLNLIRDQWELITFTNGNISPLSQNVRYIDILPSTPSIGETVVLHFNQLRKVASPPTGYVTITLDGAYKKQYTQLKPLLDAKGYRAVMMYSRPDLIGTGSYMTLDELKDCQQSGWDISTHSGYRVDQMIETELVDLAMQKQQSLSVGEFEIKRGGRFICALQNQWNELAVKTLSKYFYFLRTGAGSVLQNAPQHTSLPIFNPKNIPDIASNATYGQQVSLLQNAATHKSWACLTWHDPDRSGELTLQQMEDVLNLIESSGMKVVTFSDVYDKILRLPNI